MALLETENKIASESIAKLTREKQDLEENLSKARTEKADAINGKSAVDASFQSLSETLKSEKTNVAALSKELEELKKAPNAGSDERGREMQSQLDAAEARVDQKQSEIDALQRKLGALTLTSQVPPSCLPAVCINSIPSNTIYLL